MSRIKENKIHLGIRMLLNNNQQGLFSWCNKSERQELKYQTRKK